MSAETEIPEVTGTGLERFQQKPIIDRIEPRTLELIQSTIAKNCTGAEVGHFLELCAHYQLDPFAREAWVAKSKSGKLLIMVGRDGLRRIAQRNGIHLDGDVVRENDDFAIRRTPDGNRTVTHSYGKPSERAAIVGAWAECREGGPEGRPLGYFYAPLEEYLPANRDAYSPWSKQIGVMILGAAERQAVRQATPLSGLLAEGEDELVERPLAAGSTPQQLAEFTVGEEVSGEAEAEADPEDRLLTAEEVGGLAEAIKEAGVDSNKFGLMLAAVGVDSIGELTEKTGLELRMELAKQLGEEATG